MTSTPTDPPIKDVQNTESFLRLLAAQRRLYADAKIVHNIRLAVVGGGAVLGVISALAIPSFRTAIGVCTGVALLFIGLLGSGREKTKNREAASVQEEFDARLFQLPWNDILVERPTMTVVSEAARRYRGPSMKDWYPDTGSVMRPLDVLICQNSNLGWGASLHRAWSTGLTVLLTALVIGVVLVAVLLRLSFIDTIVAILVPMLPFMREQWEMIKANVDNAQAKGTAEGKLLALWRRGMSNPASVTAADCRGVQDCIFTLRRTNASIPDWFNRLRRDAHEKAMRDTATELVAEARRNGVA